MDTTQKLIPQFPIQPTNQPAKMPRIVIIGGGPAGINAAQTLAKSLKASDKTEVVVIEKSKYQYYTIGAPRAYTETSYAANMFIPYDNAIPKEAASFVKIVRGVVTAITTHEVVYQYIGNDDKPQEAASTLAFDYLLIATGSSYTTPIKQDGNNYSRAHTEAQLKEVRDQVARAKKILIVGGGSVGCEVAGDIAAHYPDKSVTIINGQNRLVAGNNLRDKFYTKLTDSLQKLKVNVILGDSLEERLTENRFEKRVLRTVKGREIESDIQLLCAGFSPVAELVQHLNPSLVDARGAVRVNQYLQIDNASYHHIFALGDVSNHSTPKMAYWAGEQAKYVAGELVNVIRKKQTKISKPFPEVSVEAIFVPLGPNGGVAQLPLFGGWVVGDTMTRMIKSKDMMAGRIWASLGATAPAV
ncbi:hypothetical protein Poli38472_005735 [Pythium oligandrum]|uniref:FAD/NAD(P)-binding domain-containing protein n=1 Tax=Pythium oligandrum TaxID=41045 RepID=A0A8K1FQS8_PYTOL|nr:hypothetical protein Poli38472_005735 [Pythium oligandrum]|eukprot:TMW68267.1 hypothetical protein Poli38472_005735 [Pythium oligandrum]